MKKVLFALFVGVLTMGALASCTNDQDDDKFDFLATDKDKQECTGCDNGDN
ncbi:hypothetical protein [Flagellimonas sp. SN16]|uniref:hypothetical protein n=1 Tax=Flagellimonas sp. SN16 TaxID=3415142 RepID=UPI003C645125